MEAERMQNRSCKQSKQQKTDGRPCAESGRLLFSE